MFKERTSQILLQKYDFFTKITDTILANFDNFVNSWCFWQRM